MSQGDDNPCTGCSTNQHCCSRLSGLVLARDEFERLFRQHQDRLLVRRSNRVVYVSAADGGACPHWGDTGCRVYRDRAIDCRLFPYIPFHVIERARSVKIVYHDRSDCPLKHKLLPRVPEAEVRALLAALGHKMYGNSKSIIVTRQTGWASRLRHRFEAALSRRLYKGAGSR